LPLQSVLALLALSSIGLEIGKIFDRLGNWQGFLILAGAGLIATVLLWSAMPETKPTKYLD
jgi:predicted MFS family arabinose efflux permease